MNWRDIIIQMNMNSKKSSIYIFINVGTELWSGITNSVAILETLFFSEQFHFQIYYDWIFYSRIRSSKQQTDWLSACAIYFKLQRSFIRTFLLFSFIFTSAVIAKLFSSGVLVQRTYDRLFFCFILCFLRSFCYNEIIRGLCLIIYQLIIDIC